MALRSPLRREPDEKLDSLAHKVIGAAIEVHKTLGPGYIESVYEEALCIELKERGIPFIRQPKIEIGYKGQKVGEGRFDLLAGNDLIVEIKAVDSLAPIHTAQLMSYMKATGKMLGLLINFNVSVLKDGIKRIIIS
ncbi:MAG TPA: GxxExxY protein [bacterium]|nr:GxxExxY protein [bacterium]